MHHTSLSASERQASLVLAVQLTRLLSLALTPCIINSFQGCPGLQPWELIDCAWGMYIWSRAKRLIGDMSIADQERDDVLLRRAAKGDEVAFTLLYRRHQAALYRFALRMSGSAWAAEEIVQDVFMTLMRDPKKFDPARGTLGAFLYGVTRNRVLKHLERSPQREVPLEEKNEN